MTGSNHNGHFNRAHWLEQSRRHFLSVAPGYDGGRAFEKGKFWASEIAARVPIISTDTMLDVGCGTGLFTIPFAETLGCTVIGIEPSQVMLKAAVGKSTPGRVGWLQGTAEKLPFQDGAFQAIFLSQVWHHLADSERAAREFYRVLRPGGGLFVKTFSHDQLKGRWDLKVVFPELMRLMLNIYPDIADFQTLFQRTGFGEVDHNDYDRPDTMRPSALLKTADDRLWSMFSIISEQGRQAGMTYLRELMDNTGDAPVSYNEIHLLVVAKK